MYVFLSNLDHKYFIELLISISFLLTNTTGTLLSLAQTISIPEPIDGIVMYGPILIFLAQL